MPRISPAVVVLDNSFTDYNVAKTCIEIGDAGYTTTDADEESEV
jgi:hypothetical protein